jgi:N-acetylglucosaminyldiphosphoundecaprenol N-acetyl-beta-D-mannosaminyltransferase
MAMMPERVDIFGTRVSVTTVGEVAEHVLGRREKPGTVVIANVHSVMSARRDPLLTEVFEMADVVTPDGMPLVWALKASDRPEAVRVTGIEVMRRAFDIGRPSGTRHFFYGSSPDVLDRLVDGVNESFPGVEVCGAIAPAFGAIADEDIVSAAEAINHAQADIVWIGLGMPKQELWMARVAPLLPGVSLVGVGAAFDWLAGTKSVAPQWMQDRGLEWAYRLAQEPRRLWRRYIFNNPAFLMLLFGRWVETSIKGLLPGRSRSRRPKPPR